MRLEDAGAETLPRGPGLHLLTLAVDQVPIKLTTTGVDVHLGGPEPSSALPEVSNDPEGHDDEESKVGLEEVFGGTDTLANRGDSGVELKIISTRILMEHIKTYLSDKNDDDDEETEP